MKTIASLGTVFVGSICLFVALAFGGGPQGAVYQFTVPKQGSMVANPTYYCWIPESVMTLRCVIVHQHGCTREGDASQMMGDLQWLTLAKKWHAAFIAPSLTTGSDCNNWDQMANGSGNTFLAALDTLAKRSGHAEISTIPWALWGHSGGSMWATAMLGKYPQKIAVVVAQACGTDVSNVDAALTVPVLHHNGKFDLCYNDSYFANGRKRGALWAHAINPDVAWIYNPNNDPMTMMGHAPKDLRMIAIDWIDICLTARLPDQAGSSQLKDMDTSNAWLGDTATRNIAPASNFSGNKLSACWFPNAYMAQRWHEYMLTSQINDSTPPPTPYNLTGAYSGRRIVLKWDADADLETGIKTFVIYRNNIPYDTCKYPNMPPTHFTLEKGFQRWNDGDQPVPNPAPAMTYTDSAANDTGTYVYQIANVNWLNGVSPKSASLTLSRGLVGVMSGKTASSIQRPSSIIRLDAGFGYVKLYPGITDVYDVRGRLLLSIFMQNEGTKNIGQFMRAKEANVLIIKPRVCQQ